MILKVQRLRKEARLPSRSGPLEAGLDLYACESVTLSGGDGPRKIATGVAVVIPPGHVGLVCDRSGLGAKGLKVHGGVIDETYRGELCVLLSYGVYGDAYHAFVGDRVAQLLVLPVALPAVEEVKSLPASGRGEKGFGSSGR